jgi:haloalkane dehalogenase
VNTDAPNDAMRDNLRGVRYCEIFVVTGSLTHITGAVYNTLGLNDCPAEEWKALNPDAIKKAFKARAVVMNGPRYFLMDQAALQNPGAVVSVDGLQLRLLATIRLPVGSLIGGNRRKPYTEHTIERTTYYLFAGGRLVHELIAPHGQVYIMQSYAQIVDPTQTEASLETLASRLQLPQGWHYRVRRLDQDYVVHTTGEAHVIQDDFQNTYQRVDS